MKKIWIIILLLLGGYTAGYAQTQVSTNQAIEFNNKIADITKEISHLGISWGEVFHELYIGSKDYAQLKQSREKLEQFINAKLLELTKAQVPKPFEELKNACIQFLVYEDQLLKKAFIPFEKFNSKTSSQEMKLAIDNLTNLARDEEKMLSSVNNALEKLAKAYGFRIDKE